MIIKNQKAMTYKPYVNNINHTTNKMLGVLFGSKPSDESESSNNHHRLASLIADSSGIPKKQAKMSNTTVEASSKVKQPKAPKAAILRNLLRSCVSNPSIAKMK